VICILTLSKLQTWTHFETLCDRCLERSGCASYGYTPVVDILWCSCWLGGGVRNVGWASDEVPATLEKMIAWENEDRLASELPPSFSVMVKVFIWKRSFPVFTCRNVCFDIFILVLGLFAFSVLALSHQHFTGKHCLQISELRMCGFTRNRFLNINFISAFLETDYWFFQILFIKTFFSIVLTGK